MKELPISVFSIDLGSTLTKTDPNPINRGSESRIDFKPKTEEIKIENYKFRILTGKKYEEFITNIKQSITEFREDTEDDRIIRLTTITGFTNSLAIVYNDPENPNKQKVTVLLDDPSLTPDLNEEQKEILKKYNIPIDKKATTLMKLLALKNNPQLVKALFGEGTNFEDLRFSTMIGAIIWELKGRQMQNLSVPFDDLKGFGRKDITLEETMQLLEELGINNSQITRMKIDNSYFTQTFEGIVFSINDFTSEMKFIDQLLIHNKIPQNSVIFGLDSVGKIIFPNSLNPKSESTKAFPEVNERYTTQRMTGNVITEWFAKRLGFKKENGENDYEGIDKFLQTANLETPFYYDPNTDSLYLIENERLNLVDLEKNNKIIADKREQLVIAIALGTINGLKEKMEQAIDINQQEKPKLYFYGGLMLHKGWQRIINVVFSDYTNHWLKIPNANLTTQFLVKQRMSQLKEEPNVQIESLDK